MGRYFGGGWGMLYISEPIRILKRRLLIRSEGARFLRERFQRLHGYVLDLSNITTFSEKLYRRMIETNRGENPIFTRLADKLLARDYVKDLIGSEFLIPLLWNGQDPARIPFDDLPERSIAMTNHGSGGNIVLRKPIDRAAAIKTLSKGLKTNYYWALREYQYYNIAPRVMVEELLDDDNPDGPLDYRFWCFNGKPEAIQVDNHSHTLNAFYDVNWQNLRLSYRATGTQRDVGRPRNLDEMLSVATKLSVGFDFVRIDLYSVYGKTYFGEFAFTPTAGMNKFDPPHWDLYFGEKWT
jgi:hypothetical protein